MQKIASLMQIAWKRFKDWHSKTKIANLLNTSSEEWKSQLDQNFNDAKKISDFIGFITRLIFLQFVIYYCLSKSPKEENSLISYSLAVIATASIWIQIRFFASIFALCMAYFCKDIAIYKRQWAKILMAFVSIIQVLILYSSIFYFVREVSKNSSLLK